jgi:hypothetical protein
MANHTINPCRGCRADLGETDADICQLCEAEQMYADRPCTGAKVAAFDWMTREQMLVSLIHLIADCERLRRELDDATGVIR